MTFDPRNLSDSERSRCLEVLGLVRGQIDVLPLSALGQGPQQLACDYMRRRSGEIIDTAIADIISAIDG